MSLNRTVQWIAALAVAIITASSAMAECESPQFVELPSFAAGLLTHDIKVVDVDNDGNADVLAVARESVYVHRGNGDGTFLGMPALAVSDAEEIAVGDLNGDTYADLVLSYEPGVEEVCVNAGSCAGYNIALNNGDGTFGIAAYTTVPFVATVAAVAIADFNGDGNGDVLIAGAPVTAADPEVHVLLGDGTGAFPSRRSWSVDGDVRDAEAIRLGGTVNPDVLLAVGPGAASSFMRLILYRDVSGTFPNQSASREIVQTASDVQLAVRNNDVVFSFEQPNGIGRVGTVYADIATFSEPAFHSEAGPRLTDFALIDIDEDGDHDVVSTLDANHWMAFMRHGTGFNWPPHIVRTGPFGDNTARADRVEMADVDLDARPDMLFFDSAHERILVLRNSCASRYVDVQVRHSTETYGNSLSIYVEVLGRPGAPTPTGTVRLYELDGPEFGTTTLDGFAHVGYAYFELQPLPLGEHWLQAEYQGDSEYPPHTNGTVAQISRGRFGAPLGFSATGGAANEIALRWYGTQDSILYTVFRLQNGQWTPIGTTQDEQFIDSDVNDTAAYAYTVRAHNGEDETSDATKPDIATTAKLALPADRRIRANDITSTRLLIQSLRSAAGLAQFTFTDSSLTGLKVKAVHMTELRDALLPARAASGMFGPFFTNKTITPGVTPVRLVDIMEIRNSFQ